MQHPVILDKATAARLGYGSTCILSPSGVATASNLSDGRGGDGGSGGGQGESVAGVAKDVTESDNVPDVGGTFRMWSDYRMSLEGHARNVQASTLLPPVLDVAWTVADSFRRRWAAGGQYPERKLARVMLAERGGGDDTEPHRPAADDGEIVRNEKEAIGGNGEGAEDTPIAMTSTRMSKSRWRKISSFVWPNSKTVAARGGADAGSLEGGGGGEGSEVCAREGEDNVVMPSSLGRRGGGQPHSFRQALSRLDGLDSDTFVEEALDDLHDEERRQNLSSTSKDGAPVARWNRGSRGRNDQSDGNIETASGVAVGIGIAPVTSARSRLASVGESAREGVAVTGGTANDDDDEGETDVMEDAEVAAAAAEAAASQRQVTEKFMLPGWHYLFLSGRQLSIDLRWSNMDLLLMQDPTARQGRDSGKNVLALRSSGALTVRSSGPGESVDAQLEGAALLPCFYNNGRFERGGKFESGAAESHRRRRDRGEGEDASLSRPRGSDDLWQEYRMVDEDVRVAGGPGRLAQLLGAGERTSAAVMCTWLGQGLVIADSRPLVEPFSMHFGYGTVVAQTAQEGHGTGVTAGRTVMATDDRRGERTATGMGDGEENGELSGVGVDVDEDDAAEEDGLGRSMLNKENRGEVVAGVFRVAVSELQLLAARTGLKGSATIEVEVILPCTCHVCFFGFLVDLILWIYSLLRRSVVRGVVIAGIMG